MRITQCTRPHDRKFNLNYGFLNPSNARLRAFRFFYHLSFGIVQVYTRQHGRRIRRGLILEAALRRPPGRIRNAETTRRVLLLRSRQVHGFDVARFRSQFLGSPPMALQSHP
jgi:hypothetical protein